MLTKIKIIIIINNNNNNHNSKNKHNNKHNNNNNNNNNNTSNNNNNNNKNYKIRFLSEPFSSKRFLVPLARIFPTLGRCLITRDYEPLRYRGEFWQLSVHTGNFSPVDQNEVQETKEVPQNQRGGKENCIIHDYRSLVDSCNLTSKVNSHTLKAKTHNPILAPVIRKWNCFVENALPRSPGQECSYGKIFVAPVTEISVVKAEISVIRPARLLIWAHRNFNKGESSEARSRKSSQGGWPG